MALKPEAIYSKKPPMALLVVDELELRFESCLVVFELLILLKSSYFFTLLEMIYFVIAVFMTTFSAVLLIW